MITEISEYEFKKLIYESTAKQIVILNGKDITDKIDYIQELKEDCIYVIDKETFDNKPILSEFKLFYNDFTSYKVKKDDDFKIIMDPKNKPIEEVVLRLTKNYDE